MSYKQMTQYHFNDSLTQYGDGVFETMLGVGDSIHHWDYHWQRLESSCQRLQITVPDHELLEQQLHTELAKQNSKFSVVKMIVSRGAGLRGYRSHVQQPCYVQFSISPYQFNASLYQGLNIRICQTRLSHQPLLAGMKHINRLEYVMARREAEDALFDEGLLLNYDNDLIEGLISNVFIIKDNHLLTPDLCGSGVAGTLRAYLLDKLPTWGFSVKVKRLTIADLHVAEEVFLTNATHGIMPVAAIQGIPTHFTHTVTHHLRHTVGHPCCEL